MGAEEMDLSLDASIDVLMKASMRKDADILL